MRTSMKPEYGNTPRVKNPPRSTFNKSESYKTTFNASYLIPFYWDFLYPGEVRKGKTNAFVRISNPLDFPLMDNLYLTVHWFDVSLRILWDNFRKFFGERENPDDSIDYTVPTLGGGNLSFAGDSVEQRLVDHMGLPHRNVRAGDVGVLALRAYNKIYNYWYRDGSIQDSIPEFTDDGPDPWNATNYAIRQRGKMFDYFTNVLPAPQRGESVQIGGEIGYGRVEGNSIGIRAEFYDEVRSIATSGADAILDTTAVPESNVMYPNTTINELRNAAALQQFLERDNRSGTRFGDLIYGHYGTEFQDARYAPVFIAGGRAPLTVTPISNTAQSDPGGPGANELGELGAIGTGTFAGANFTYAATEPSILMGIMCVDADLSYSQGLERKWSNRTRYDFMWPEFQGIGDQALLLQELYYQLTDDDTSVFGYSPRYEERRTGVNKITREFRSQYSAPLDSWHVAQDFVGAPTLNDTFIKSSVPMGRVVKNSQVDHFLADMFIEQYSTCGLSMSGVPGLARL